MLIFFLERYSHDKVINTVVNINDSNAAEVLNIFNVSKDDVLRRIESFGHSQPNNLNSRPQNVERHMDHEVHTNPGNNSSRPGMETEKEYVYVNFIFFCHIITCVIKFDLSNVLLKVMVNMFSIRNFENTKQQVFL